MSFLGTYFNLTGYRIGAFTIDQLIGRDRSGGAPVWRVICGQCGQNQSINHARLAHLVETKATQRSLFCNNSACPLSRDERYTESLADLRRQERHEELQTAEAKRISAVEAARQREKDAKLAALKADYRKYWNHQMRTSIEQSKIVTFDRWQQLRESTRAMILERISKDPTVFFEGI